MNNALPYQDLSIIYLALAVVLLPLAAFLVNVIIVNGSKVSGWVSTIAIFAACMLSAKVFSATWNKPVQHMQVLWFSIGMTKVYAGMLLNNLSVLMLLLVTVIALPVHIYSIAYMKGDSHYSRYFACLSLFCFSMLALVIADNLIVFYAFWELVGFSSYLLIGFWYTRPKAVMANKKAFIMNRLGDIGLLSAIVILFTQFHTFDLLQLFGDNGLVTQAIIKGGLWIAPASHLPLAWQYIAFGGIFLAVAAKSAQFPLHTWLPDAMEGPTSVSALIHAATMVAAGVFLLGRIYPFFNDTELAILAIIGCFTAFMAATIALTQNDLKRILAYSTISQLGYMVMAMGIGAYTSSLFHLFTHAFFKCLLFLVAGMVIHEMQHIKEENKLDIDPQNIHNMGGLRKKMPFTFIAAVVAALALIGIPLTSGYLSKDGILIQTFEWSDNKNLFFRLIPIGAIVTSWLTAFYVSRLIVKVFLGDLKLMRHHPGITLHISDGGWHFRVPMILLAVCCLFPLFSFNPFLYENAWIYNGFKQSGNLERIDIYHTIIPVGVNLISLLVIYFAWSLYVKRQSIPFPQTGLFYNLSFREWYLDKAYGVVFIKPVMALPNAAFWFDRSVINGFIHLLGDVILILSRIVKWIDRYVIDSILIFVAALVKGIGNFARHFQGGKVQYYLFSMLAIVLLIFIIKILI